VSVKRRGIEYGIGAIPLGGYVKIPGMHRPSSTDVDLHFGPALREEPSLVREFEALKRDLDAGDHVAARAALDQVREALDAATLTRPARRASLRGLQEIDDALGPDAYWRQTTSKRVAVIAAGPGTNFVFAIVLFAILFMVGNGAATTRVGTVSPNHPAAAIGLKPGDDIVAVNGKVIEHPEQISTGITGSKGKPVTVAVYRNGRLVVLGPVKPKKEQGAYRLGFVLRGSGGLSPPEAVWQSIKLTGTIVKETAKSFAGLVHGSGRKNISGTVGIVQASSDALQQSVQSYLWILGLISLSLALLNLLPLLPLDGGHIAFSIVEGIRGRAIRREVYERVSAVGIALVLLLAFIGLSSDIGRIRGG
jgi:regulator of sigma E protease